jgi:hypothetical protein
VFHYLLDDDPIVINGTEFEKELRTRLVAIASHPYAPLRREVLLALAFTNKKEDIALFKRLLQTEMVDSVQAAARYGISRIESAEWIRREHAALPDSIDWYSLGDAMRVAFGGFGISGKITYPLSKMASGRGNHVWQPVIPALVVRMRDFNRNTVHISNGRGEGDGEYFLRLLHIIRNYIDRRALPLYLDLLTMKGVSGTDEAVLGLMTLGQWTAPMVVDSLLSPDIHSRYCTALGLVKMYKKDPNFFTNEQQQTIRERLSRNVWDESERGITLYRQGAVQALGSFGDVTTIQLLLTVAASDTVTGSWGKPGQLRKTAENVISEILKREH